MRLSYLLTSARMLRVFNEQVRAASPPRLGGPPGETERWASRRGKRDGGMPDLQLQIPTHTTTGTTDSALSPRERKEFIGRARTFTSPELNSVVAQPIVSSSIISGPEATSPISRSATATCLPRACLQGLGLQNSPQEPLFDVVGEREVSPDGISLKEADPTTSTLNGGLKMLEKTNHPLRDEAATSAQRRITEECVFNKQSAN